MKRSLLQILFKIETTLAVMAFITAAGAVLLDVLGRELIGEGLWGAQRLAVYAAVTAGFLGIGLATHAGMHLRPQFADGWLPASFQPQLRSIGPALTALLFFILAGYAVGFVYQSFSYNQLTPVLDWPMWIVQIIMPYAFISNGVRNLIYALEPDLTPESTGIF